MSFTMDTGSGLEPGPESSPAARTTAYYEHIRVNGLPRERGRQYGAKAAAKIRLNIQHYLRPGQLPPWEKTVEYIHRIYVPGLEQYFASALEEMKGIAEGAGVTLEEIVMLNARYDLSRAPGGSRHRPKPTAIATTTAVTTAVTTAATSLADDWDDMDNECTSAAFWPGTTAGGAVYTAQNWDISAHLYSQDLVILLEVHPDPSEGLPSMFLITEAGQMGRSGMNSAGLGLTSNSLNSSADYFPDLAAAAAAADEKNSQQSPSPSSLPMLPVSLLRRLYLQETSFPKGLQAIYHAPRHVSNNLTLATAEGFGLCMELTPHEAFVLPPASPTAGHVVHSNHFLAPDIRARSDLADTYPGGSSWFRNLQLAKGVQPFLEAAVTEDVLIKAFGDHLGYPQSLCVHVDTSGGDGIPGYPFKKSMTVACVVYDLTRKVVTVCKGPPCQGVFEKFRLD